MDSSVDQKLKEHEATISRLHLAATMRLLDALERRFGRELIAAVEEHYGGQAGARYAEKGRGLPERTIEGLLSVLFEPAKSAGIEYTAEPSNGGVQITCTKCPWYENAKKVQKLVPGIDALKWGYHMFCCTDPYITEGFNPKMGFKRSKTLMQGHDCCDHFYYYKEQH